MRYQFLSVSLVFIFLLSGCTSKIDSTTPIPPLESQATESAQLTQQNELKVGKADNTTQNRFTIKYPQDWMMSTSDYNSDPSYFVRFEKQDHKLEISNLPRGGGTCLYKGDSDYNGPHADYRDLTYQEYTYSFGTVRSVRK